jgi:hypothetical protein
MAGSALNEHTNLCLKFQEHFIVIFVKKTIIIFLMEIMSFKEVTIPRETAIFYHSEKQG